MSVPYLSDVIKAATGYDLPLPLPMFGVFVLLAMLVAATYLRHELSRLYTAGEIGPAYRRVKGSNGVVTLARVTPQEVVSDFSIIVLIAGIIGSRVFHIFEHLGEF
ncbi:MAG: prolipoprotein diacylglyceryl transferase, partial [Pseudomonadota bacterium]|nr:prolipoprotein diacylglyceryl transferase [Pseudomonadota bacterium]